MAEPRGGLQGFLLTLCLASCPCIHRPRPDNELTDHTQAAGAMGEKFQPLSPTFPSLRRRLLDDTSEPAEMWASGRMGAPSASTSSPGSAPAYRSSEPSRRGRRRPRLARSGRAIPCTVTGYAPLGIERVGGAWVLEPAQQRQQETRHGVFVFGIRSALYRHWLPAIAALLGETPSRSGECRAGLAEVMVLARPVAAQQTSRTSPGTGYPRDLPGRANSARALSPESTSVEVVELLGVSHFRVGMSGGPWLLQRLSDASARAEAEIRSQLLQGRAQMLHTESWTRPRCCGARGCGWSEAGGSTRAFGGTRRGRGRGCCVVGGGGPARGFDQIQHEI